MLFEQRSLLLFIQEQAFVLRLLMCQLHDLWLLDCAELFSCVSGCEAGLYHLHLLFSFCLQLIDRDVPRTSAATVQGLVLYHFLLKDSCSG